MLIFSCAILLVLLIFSINFSFMKEMHTKELINMNFDEKSESKVSSVKKRKLQKKIDMYKYFSYCGLVLTLVLGSYILYQVIISL